MNHPHYHNTYVDTRGFVDEPLTFTQAIVRGIAPGGGLFVPKVLPRFALDDLLALASKPYAVRAAEVFKAFGVDLPSETIDACMEGAYSTNFDAPEITPIKQLDSETFVLELFHGPTLAFKDLALQCMPRFFSAAIDTLRAQDAPEAREDFLILVATSGDTGKAALEGFANRAHTSIIVYYPFGGVSDLQQAQMLTTLGSNVSVCGLRGNFDDCQTAVKQVFGDEAFKEDLATTQGLRFSSANSINWGRLLPQVVYYVSAYAQMVASGAVQAGEPIDVCVPTGNFGNILAAWYAAEAGVPIEQLFCASNTNRVLTDFINTGVYDIRERSFVATPSPSMDILVSSNLERLLFELNGRNPEQIQAWMQELNSEKRFVADKQTFAALRERFSADWVSVEDSLATIREVYETYDYLLDPHTAVAYKVAERLRGANPVLVVATAHWCKFGADVYKGLTGIKAGDALPQELADLGGFALNRYLSEHFEHAGAVPERMAELEGMEHRFGEVCDADYAAIKESILLSLPLIVDRSEL
ncbi:MAG: threonine synthase [Coriobacteriales bacterium]|nr:threonine synthase [Coriobacteriales bacterium]